MVRTAHLVRSATRLTRLPFVPEISIHQSDDIYALWARTERELGRAGLPPPFWGVAWPGGQALARYLLDHPVLVTGRTVLDFGSGSGVVAIAAAKAGAASVVASETDPLGRAAIELNAAVNGVGRTVLVRDAGAGDGAAAGATDVMLAGDVWYERELADRVSGCLDDAAAAGACVLTGDIGRRYFPRGRYQCLASYDVPASIALEGKQMLRAAVWQATPGTSRGHGVCVTRPADPGKPARPGDPAISRG